MTEPIYSTMIFSLHPAMGRLAFFGKYKDFLLLSMTARMTRFQGGAFNEFGENRGMK